MKKTLIVILKIHLHKEKLLKIELNAFNWSTLTRCFYVIEKGEELWLMLIIHIITKRNDSGNIILCFLHDMFPLLFIIYLLGSANILKLLVKWKNQLMIGEIYLRTKSICIPLASIFTSYLLKGQFRLLSLKLFRT